MARARPFSVLLAHEALADVCQQWQASPVASPLQRYTVLHGVSHLLDSGRAGEAEARLLDLRYCAALIDQGTADAALDAWRAVGIDRAARGFTAVARSLPPPREGQTGDGSAAISVAGFLDDAGLSPSALVLAEWGWQVLSSRLGGGHRDTLDGLSVVADCNASLGHLDVAARLHSEVLDLSQRALGIDHPDTLNAHSALAGILMELGRHDEALVQYRIDHETSLRVHGPDHRHTLTAAVNLGSALGEAGSHSEAETLLRRTLSNQERLLGPEDPDTLHSVGELAETLRHVGRHAEAAELSDRNLVWCRRYRGTRHPDTLLALCNHGAVLSDVGQLESAEDAYLEAIEGLESLRGPHHPDTRHAVGELAALYRSQGRLTESERWLRHSLALGAATQADPHCSDRSTRVALAWNLYEQQRWEDAARQLELLVAGTATTAGPAASIPATRSDEAWLEAAEMRRALATCYRGLGQPRKAAVVAEHEWRGYVHGAGPTDPRTLEVAWELVTAWRALGDMEAARRVARAVLFAAGAAEHTPPRGAALRPFQAFLDRQPTDTRTGTRIRTRRRRRRVR